MKNFALERIVLSFSCDSVAAATEFAASVNFLCVTGKVSLLGGRGGGGGEC